MFAFRSPNPNRRVQSTKSFTPARGLKIFGQHQSAPREPEPKPEPEPEPKTKPKLEYEDNSSVDMSLYTTQSKSTIRCLTGNDSCDLPLEAPTEFTDEIANKMRAKMVGKSQKQPQTSVVTPEPSPILNTPFDERSIESSDFDLHQTSTIAMLNRFKLELSQASAFKKVPSSPKRKVSTKPTAWGPVDLDESIADASSLASSSNFLTPNNMTAPDTYERRLVNDSGLSPALQATQAQETSTAIFRKSIAQNDDDSSLIFVDGEGEEVVFQEVRSQLSHEQRDHDDSRNWEDGDSINLDDIDDPGSVLLTSGELERHLNKVQNMQVLPSSDIKGFDTWRQRQERRQRYFAKLQEKANERKKERAALKKVADQPPQNNGRSSLTGERQQLQPHHNNSYARHTRQPMDLSVDSPIPTRYDGTPTEQHNSKPGHRRRWSFFTLLQPSINNNKNKKAASESGKKTKKRFLGKKNKKPKEVVVSLSQFIRHSSDEPLEVADLSLAPLEKLGRISLASSMPGVDTMAGTRSHHLDVDDGGLKFRARQHLELERLRQRQAEFEREREERLEQERISRLKEEYLQRQRWMNRQPPMSWQLPPRQHRPYQPSREGDSTYGAGSVISNQRSINSCPSKMSSATASTFALDDSVLENATSICTKPSVDFSFKSASSVVLAPCVLCNTNERTHIAMPCMHFYFCKDCVEDMHQANNVICPVCNTNDVAFTKVFTG